MFKRSIAIIVIITFILSTYQPVQAQVFNVNELPVPGQMVDVSKPFVPMALKGLVIDPHKPLQFRFILDTGSSTESQEELKSDANRLVKYFLAGLTIPEGELWVNLSPYEKNRMIPDSLGATDLGRDLLAQDYVLKQLTASMIYPEKGLGQEFWHRVYVQAQAQFGTTNIPINTFNKVWILPDEAKVFENGTAAYVTKATLKVMLDEDYTALQKHIKNNSHSLASTIIRQIILPQITREVNTGRNFAPLRQIYDAMILAQWYKQNIQNSLIDALYTNKNKIIGINLNDPTIKEQIYDRYLQAYKKGVFNYIKEEPVMPSDRVMSSPNVLGRIDRRSPSFVGDPENVVPRKYFSGGMTLMKLHVRDDDSAMSVQIAGHLLTFTTFLAVSGKAAVGALVLRHGMPIAPPKPASMGKKQRDAWERYFHYDRERKQSFDNFVAERWFRPDLLTDESLAVMGNRREDLFPPSAAMTHTLRDGREVSIEELNTVTALRDLEGRSLKRALHRNQPLYSAIKDVKQPGAVYVILQEILKRWMDPAQAAINTDPLTPVDLNENVSVVKDKTAMAKEAAQRFFADIRDARIANIGKSILPVMGVGTGTTLGLVEDEIVNEFRRDETLDLSDVVLIAQDQYVGLKNDDRRGYYYFIMKKLIEPLMAIDSHRAIKPEHFICFKGDAVSQQEEIARVDREINGLQGIYSQLLAGGANGHFAFVEPALRVDSLESLQMDTVRKGLRDQNEIFINREGMSPEEVMALVKASNSIRLEQRLHLGRYQDIVDRAVERRQEYYRDELGEQPPPRSVLEQHIKIELFYWGRKLFKEQTLAVYIKPSEQLSIDRLNQGLPPDLKVKVIFKDADQFWTEPARVVDLTIDTMIANSRFFELLDEVPVKAYTLVGHLLKASKIRQVAFKTEMTPALGRMMDGPLTFENPSSILPRQRGRYELIMTENIAEAIKAVRPGKEIEGATELKPLDFFTHFANQDIYPTTVVIGKLGVTFSASVNILSVLEAAVADSIDISYEMTDRNGKKYSLDLPLQINKQYPDGHHWTFAPGYQQRIVDFLKGQLFVNVRLNAAMSTMATSDVVKIGTALGIFAIIIVLKALVEIRSNKTQNLNYQLSILDKSSPLSKRVKAAEFLYSGGYTHYKNYILKALPDNVSPGAIAMAVYLQKLADREHREDKNKARDTRGQEWLKAHLDDDYPEAAYQLGYFSDIAGYEWLTQYFKKLKSTDEQYVKVSTWLKQLSGLFKQESSSPGNLTTRVNPASVNASKAMIISSFLSYFVLNKNDVNQVIKATNSWLPKVREDARKTFWTGQGAEFESARLLYKHIKESFMESRKDWIFEKIREFPSAERESLEEEFMNRETDTVMWPVLDKQWRLSDEFAVVKYDVDVSRPIISGKPLPMAMNEEFIIEPIKRKNLSSAETPGIAEDNSHAKMGINKFIITKFNKDDINEVIEAATSRWVLSKVKRRAREIFFTAQGAEFDHARLVYQDIKEALIERRREVIKREIKLLIEVRKFHMDEEEVEENVESFVNRPSENLVWPAFLRQWEKGSGLYFRSKYNGEYWSTTYPKQLLSLPFKEKFTIDPVLTKKFIRPSGIKGRKLKNGGHATLEHVKEIKAILNTMAAAEGSEDETELLRAVYFMAQKPGYQPAPWIMHILEGMNDIKSLFDEVPLREGADKEWIYGMSEDNRNIILSVFQERSFSDPIGSAFEDNSDEASPSALTSAAMTVHLDFSLSDWKSSEKQLEKRFRYPTGIAVRGTNIVLYIGNRRGAEESLSSTEADEAVLMYGVQRNSTELPMDQYSVNLKVIKGQDGTWELAPDSGTMIGTYLHETFHIVLNEKAVLSAAMTSSNLAKLDHLVKVTAGTHTSTMTGGHIDYKYVLVSIISIILTTLLGRHIYKKIQMAKREKIIDYFKWLAREGVFTSEKAEFNSKMWFTQYKYFPVNIQETLLEAKNDEHADRRSILDQNGNVLDFNELDAYKIGTIHIFTFDAHYSIWIVITDNNDGGYNVKIGTGPQLVNAAMKSFQIKKAALKGGIDLNRINVRRAGKIVTIQFDPAQLHEITRNGFAGFEPVIEDFQYIKSPFPLLGVQLRGHNT